MTLYPTRGNIEGSGDKCKNGRGNVKCGTSFISYIEPEILFAELDFLWFLRSLSTSWTHSNTLGVKAKARCFFSCCSPVCQLLSDKEIPDVLEMKRFLETPPSVSRCGLGCGSALPPKHFHILTPTRSPQLNVKQVSPQTLNLEKLFAMLKF